MTTILSPRLPALALLLASLGGCGSSAPVRYYALTVAAGPPVSGSAQMLVEVLPIAVPERLNRAEMVLTGSDGRLDVRPDDQWAAPLSDEIGQVIDDALWRKLRAADVYRAPVAPAPGSPPQYRLALRIERFETGPGPNVAVNGSWTIRRLPLGVSATCRADLTGSLPSVTPAAAAAALSQSAGRLAGLVADSIGRLDHGEAAVCPTEDH